MIECNSDFETRSDRDIKKTGAHVYMESPHFMPLMLQYGIGGGAIRLWTRHDRACPADLRAHIESGGLIRAFNASFERGVHDWLARRWGWPAPRLEQYRCTAVQGAAMGLPRRLDKIGEALDIVMKKDRRGTALIKLFCVPRAGCSRVEFNDDMSHPAEWQEFIDYCRRDVEAEREVASRLAPLSDFEWKVYALNERINDRGLRIDVESARAALRLIETAKASINAEIGEVTGRAVTAVTQVARLKAWLATRGCNLESLDKDTIDAALHDGHDLSGDACRALRLRAEGAKPSTDKITAMLNRTSSDGRARGVYLHHGAGQTGRFSSRGVQAHNMPRYRKIFEDADLAQGELFEAIRTEDPRYLKLLYGEELGRPLHLLSDAVRGFIWAAPGRQFIIADFSSIEGRMAAWATGEHWEVEAYRALDRGEGPGIYELNAADIYQTPVDEVTKAQRKIGKVRALSCAYATGAGGISRFARQEKVKLAPLLSALWAAAPEARRGRASTRFDERWKAGDATALALGRDAWLAAELIKLGWREAHPAIVAGWEALEIAAGDAVAAPGTVHEALGGAFLVKHDFLWFRLRSGRCLAYGKPRLHAQVWAREQLDDGSWGPSVVMDRFEAEQRERDGGPTEFIGAKVKIERWARSKVTARATDSQSDNYSRFPLYGGAWFNNFIQGMARDILVHGMFEAEAAGFEVNLHTHDEIGAETEADRLDELLAAILRLPAWAEGLPMAAAGFAAKRYKKA